MEANENPPPAGSRLPYTFESDEETSRSQSDFVVPANMPSRVHVGSRNNVAVHQVEILRQTGTPESAQELEWMARAHPDMHIRKCAGEALQRLSKQTPAKRSSLDKIALLVLLLGILWEISIHPEIIRKAIAVSVAKLTGEEPDLPARLSEPKQKQQSALVIPPDDRVYAPPSTSALSLITEGAHAAGEKDYETAQQKYAAARNLKPTEAQRDQIDSALVSIYDARGGQAERKGDKQKALGFYDQALAIRPRDPTAKSHRDALFAELNPIENPTDPSHPQGPEPDAH